MLSRMLARLNFSNRDLVCRKLDSIKTTYRGSAFNTNAAAVTEQLRGSFKQSDKLRTRSFASNFAGHARSNAVVGIDLGTTNSCVAVMVDKWPVIIEDEHGERTMPSLVHLTEEGGKLVGGEAKRAADPGKTFGSSKRLIGRRLEDLHDVDRCGMMAGEKGEAWMTDGEGNSFSPVDLASLLLTKLKKTAELYLDEEVSRAVIAVPAHFNHSQRKATKQAALNAGLNVLRVINEPTAAALAYGLGELERLPSITGNCDELSFGGQKLTAVYDLGGGTFDVSLLQMHDGVFQVRSTDGDPLLGGDDFDGVLAEQILSKFEARQAKLVRHDKTALSRIKDAAEKAKVELSLMKRTVVKLPAMTADNSPLEFDLSRGEYERMVEHLVQRTVPPCERALTRAGIARSDIEQVLLVGGMTSMPFIRKTVRDIFNCEPLTDTDYEPDEAVAAGAAIQGAVLTGELSDLLLIDVATTSLNIKTMDGAVKTVIERNTVLPARCSRTVDNAALLPHQVLEVSLHQEDETRLASVRLPDIRSIEHVGLARIDLTFEMDSDGVVGVSAVDHITGKKQRVEFDNSNEWAVGSKQKDLHDFFDMTSDYDELSMQQLEHVSLVDTARWLITDTERMVQLHLRQLPVEDAAGVIKEMNELRDTLAEVREMVDVECSELVRNKLETAQQKVVALFKKTPQPPRQK